MIYLDGSALCRFLPGVRHYEAFGGWARDHIDELVTTQLGFTELRQAAELYPRSSAERVAGIVDLVRAGVAVIRFSDDNVAISSHATAVLKPFAALHIGAAVAHEPVDTIVTYDPALANVARIYELAVVSPGLPENWYLEYQGPPEHWKPVALDAPYAPGAEFELPEIAPRPDAYEIALEEARREAAAKASLEEADAEPAPAGDGDAEPAPSDDGDAESASEATGDSEEISDLDRALRDAEAAVVPGGDVGEVAVEVDDEDDHEDVGVRQDRDRGSVDGSPPTWEVVADELGEASASAPPGRSGTYRPRIEAWHEGDAEEDRPRLEEEEEAEASQPDTTEPDPGGDGLPWSGRPEPLRGSPEPGPRPPAPLLRTPPPETPLSQTPPALAPPAPIEAVGIPNLPREERGVPPVAPPSRESIGSAVRRPMFDTNPGPDSRASRPPDPVPPVPPEESSPLTVPIKWNVELDEPEAYLPLRFSSESARVLPSLPVSFAGGQGGLTLASTGAVSVPALEPTGPALGATILDDVLSPAPQAGSGAPTSGRDRKAAEKAAKKERERLDKLAKKGQRSVPSAAPPQSPAPPPAVTLPAAIQVPATPPPTASSPAASSPAPSAAGAPDAWKLDDVVSFGKKKKGS